jgi:hypothetical protein
MPELKRIKSSSVTDALISATEQAETMKHVIILYEETDGEHAGFIVDDTFDRATCNFLVDKFKSYLITGRGDF